MLHRECEDLLAITLMLYFLIFDWISKHKKVKKKSCKKRCQDFISWLLVFFFFSFFSVGCNMKKKSKKIKEKKENSSQNLWKVNNYMSEMTRDM